MGKSYRKNIDNFKFWVEAKISQDVNIFPCLFNGSMKSLEAFFLLEW